ncbi:response regulator [Paenibacillus sp. CF384]|uniref:response regulator transcription factor n=1 Tax=Paenibacillus sp. CF384 TaxID=1884382 RepID=UPI00089A6AB3|nr:response regulator [Paenibacillus sp. CF384]SDX06716.1 Helix-turn-helix domain-containing protein [Paenibacillus sp. CF384]
MIKLMVVDDERWIREGLKQTIDWSSHGITFIGDAEDGCEALKLIDSNAPDIVISDIRMPTMDGMELIEEIERRGLDIKVIFISGFSDFVYAQKAVKLGAFDYILKPIEEKVLMEIIERCICEITNKRELALRLEELSGRVRESLPLARQKHLEMCLTQPIAGPELLSKWEALRIELKPNRLIVLSAVIHDWGEREISERGCSQLRYALGKLMEEVFHEGDVSCVACPLHENEFADAALISSWEKVTADPAMEVYRCAKLMIEGALEVLGIQISIGISSMVEGERLVVAFREALTNSARYVLYGPGRVHGPEEAAARDCKGKETVMFTAGIPSIAMKADALDMAWMNRVLHAIKLMDEGKLTDLLDQQTELLEELVKETSALAVRCEMNMYLGTLLSKWKELCLGREHSDAYFVTHQQKLELYRCTLGNWKNAIISAFLKKDRAAAGSGQRSTIEIALRYIHDNYHHGISLNKVAETIYMNPSYFSRVFHAEVGETLSRYLIRIRVAKAKELLEQTPLKIYEVAESVGYRDFRHFVKTFKESEGITPAQFRNYGT